MEAKTCAYHVGSEHRNIEAVSQQVSVILLARSPSLLMLYPSGVKPLDTKSIPTVEGGKRVSFRRRDGRTKPDGMMDAFVIKLMTSISFQRANASTSAIVLVSLCRGHRSSAVYVDVLKHRHVPDPCATGYTVIHQSF